MRRLHQLSAEPTGQLRALKTRLACVETGEVKPAGLATRSEHLLEIHLAVTFWSNQAQYNEAYKIACRVLQHKLYGATLAHVDAAIHAVFNDQTEEALIILNALRKELTE
jgi:hypothetical protein